METFNFNNIEEYLSEGCQITTKDDYVDNELTDIIFNPIPKTDIPWILTKSSTHICDTYGDPDVNFNILRWNRDADEIIEYWRSYNDMFFAYNYGSKFIIISYITGLPCIITPDICWASSNERPQIGDISFASVGNLINKIFSLGQSFVRNQIH